MASKKRKTASFDLSKLPKISIQTLKNKGPMPIQSLFPPPPPKKNKCMKSEKHPLSLFTPLKRNKCTKCQEQALIDNPLCAFHYFTRQISS